MRVLEMRQEKVERKAWREMRSRDLCTCTTHIMCPHISHNSITAKMFSQILVQSNSRDRNVNR